MTTARQDQDFVGQLIPSDLLEQSIQWIQDNMEIEDVFTWKQIEYWLSQNGYHQHEE